MKRGIWSGLAAASLIMGSFATLGCESSKKETSSSVAANQPQEHYSIGPWFPKTGEPAPAPRRAAPPAAPAPRAMGPCNYAPVAAAGMNVSPMAFPTGDVATSAVLVHQVVPAQVRVGMNYTYELHVTNITAGTLQNVVVHNEGAQNLTVVSSDPSANRGADGGSLWMLGDLAPCQTKVIKVTGKADKAGTSSSCSSVTYNNTLCASTTVVEPALKITKQITPEAILGCDPITMTVEVTNSGTGTASGVKIVDQLPAGLTNADGGSTVEIAVGDLAQGQSRPFTIPLRATRTGRFENEARASAEGGLSATSNKVATVVKQPVLTLACTASTERIIIRPGAEGCFDLTIKNAGDGISRGTVVSATVAGGTPTSADGGQVSGNIVTWSVGDLAAGASKTVKVCVRPTTMGEVTMSATAQGACATQVSTNCKINTVGTPDIFALLTDDDGVVLVGDDHILRYEVGNQGQIDLTNVTVVITLPEGLQMVSSSAPKAPVVEGRKLTFTGVTGVLRPGEKRAFTLTVKASTSGEKLVISETTADQIKTPLRNDELTVFIDR
ncbi:MAG: DUF11 domain-containing protein [Phycisphaeraceae bacterium]|nr:DUF11 domain-containing protein [Phycisphaerae bacterium]MBX3392319.1 DUF11 domain-containing protein [Phycisphaeraceae bacterium]